MRRREAFRVEPWGRRRVRPRARPRAHREVRRSRRIIRVRVTRQALVDMGALAAAGRRTLRLAPTLPLSKARLAHEMLEGIAPRPVGKIVLQPE